MGRDHAGCVTVWFSVTEKYTRISITLPGHKPATKLGDAEQSSFGMHLKYICILCMNEYLYVLCVTKLEA
jgi:hypothetical protein